MPAGIYCKTSYMGFILWLKFAYTLRARVEHNLRYILWNLCVSVCRSNMCVFPKMERALCDASRCGRGDVVSRPDSTRFESSLV